MTPSSVAAALVLPREHPRTHPQRVGMSLSKPDTYKRPDAEVLPLLTEQALKEKDGLVRGLPPCCPPP